MLTQSRYKVEPYVMAADVYSVAPHNGRGGWSWYTGSAGWAYRLLTESLLGITREGDKLSIRPLLPAAWPEVMIAYQHGSSHYRITVRRCDGESSLSLDGTPQPYGDIELIDDGREHRVDIQSGAQPSAEG